MVSDPLNLIQTLKVQYFGPILIPEYLKCYISGSTVSILVILGTFSMVLISIGDGFRSIKLYLDLLGPILDLILDPNTHLKISWEPLH